MATGRLDRSDDTAAVLKIVATVTGTEDAVTKQWQSCTISDSTDPVNNKLAVDASGNMQVDIAAASVAVPVTDNSGSLTVDNAALSVVGGGAEATALRVTLASDSTGVVSVDDNSGSLTVDNAALSVTGGGVEATALRVTLASDSTGVVSVDDNAGSLTVDGTVSVSGTVTVDSELTTADLDTGAGTDTRAVVGLVGSASGGGQLIPGSSTDGLLVNLGANNDITVTSISAGDNNIGNMDIVTVPAPLSTTGGGTEATALRVTVASDSTGVLSIDDNGGSLTVDGVTRTEYTVDAVAPASPVGTSVASERDDQLSALTEIEGDWTNLRSSAKGALWVTIPDANGDPITSFGGGTQYTEDVAAAADPIGTAVNLIRKDAPAAITGTDGDNVAQRGTNYGAAYVQVVSSGGALIDSFGGSGGTAQADKSAFTEGTTTFTPVGGVFNETISADPAEDQAAAARITAKRAVHVNLRNTAGTEITSGGGVEAAALRVTIANDSTGLVSVDDNSSSLTVDNAALSVTGGGVEATALRVTIASDSTGVLSVDDNGAALTVDNGGTFAVQATVAAAATNIAKAEDDPSANADVGVPSMAVRKATPANTSGTDGDYEMLQMSAGRLWTSATIDAALPAGTNGIGKLTANSGVDIGDVDVTSVIPGTGATNLGKAEDAAHASSDTGVFVLAVRDDSPAANSGADGDYECLHVNAEGAQWVTGTPSASGGLTIFRSLDLDETEEEIKATAGAVYTLWFTNTATATRWLKFYNATAATVVVGTTTPVMTIGLPGNTSDDISGMFSSTYGLAFGTAITVAATTGVADADTGAPGTNDCIVNIGFK